MKKILSIILSITMLFSMTAVVFAEETVTSGAREVLGIIKVGVNAEFPPFEYMENDKILGVLRDENGEVLIDENTSDKKYGWKNITEEELKEGRSKDTQKVFYLESIVENKDGNAPHTGKGFYDDGDDYREFFEDVFKGAKDVDQFDYVDDSVLPWSDIFPQDNYFAGKALGFEMVKNIDNVKCWYFTDTMTNSDLFTLTENEDGTYNAWGIERPNVGSGDFVRFYKERDDEGDGSTGIFNSTQYSVMLPYNMEGGSEDDEAAANSIVNTKALYIEFIPDLKSPDSMYEFIDDIALHYVKQIIPSTTLFKYKVPMTGWDVFCSHRTYPQSIFIED